MALIQASQGSAEFYCCPCSDIPSASTCACLSLSLPLSLSLTHTPDTHTHTHTHTHTNLIVAPRIFCKITSIYQPTSAHIISHKTHLKHFKTLRHVSILSDHHQGALSLAQVMLQYSQFNWYLQTRCCGSISCCVGMCCGAVAGARAQTHTHTHTDTDTTTHHTHTTHTHTTQTQPHTTHTHHTDTTTHHTHTHTPHRHNHTPHTHTHHTHTHT